MRSSRSTRSAASGRTTARLGGCSTRAAAFFVPAPYGEGAPVDPSGVTPAGDAFAGIGDYKQLMLQRELDQVARHLAASLLVVSTGAEVEFADRDAVERIVAEGRNERHPVRTMIHRVVGSDLFRRR